MEYIGASPSREKRKLGRKGQRQQTVYQCGVPDSSYRSSLRALPPEYGDRKNTHRRFCRWRDKGIWKEILSHLMDMPDFKRLLMDSTYCKAHPHAAGAKGGSEAPGRTKGGSTPGYIWPWLRMVCRSESLLEKAPVQIFDRYILLLKD